MSTKQITLLQAVTSLEQCVVVVARRMCLSHDLWGRQAEISLTDSSDNGRAGTIASRIIMPQVFQAHDTLFSFIWLYLCLNLPIRLQGYLGDDMRGSKCLTDCEIDWRETHLNVQVSLNGQKCHTNTTHWPCLVLILLGCIIAHIYVSYFWQCCSEEPSECISSA